MKTTIHDNPYAEAYGQGSCYTFGDGRLTHCSNGEAAGPRAIHIHHQLRAMIESPSFPCNGAKAALNRNTYRFGFYDDMGSEETTGSLCRDLCAFARTQRGVDSDFTSFIAAFDHMQLINVREFEDRVWRLLAALCEKDRQFHAWDPMASPAPEAHDFSFSFAGTAYFVIALSPVSLRMARQFVVPALIFNAHYQFENLRNRGVFTKMKSIIRAKETRLENGIANKLLTDFGDISEAVQYVSAIAADADKWECPFGKYFRQSKA